ncbi:sensor histidine kinase [Pseudonocardia sediminis]|nr:histidine kinase [Pseudonocardia sediminis]
MPPVPSAPARLLRMASPRDLTLVGASLALGAVLYPLMIVPALGGRFGGVHAALLLANFAAICLAQLFRRHAPAGLAAGTVFMIVDVLLGPSVPVWIVFADLLYAATLHGPSRLSRNMVAVATALAAVLVVSFVAVTPVWQNGLLSAAGAIPLVLVPVAWGRNVRHHQELAAAERRSADQVARIAQLDRAAAVHDERRRIARDLHDVVAGHVSSIALQAEAVSTVAGHQDPAVASILRHIRTESVRALHEMRAMIDVLRAGDEGEDDSAPGRLSDLPQLVSAVRATGLEVDLSTRLPSELTSGAVELAAYRISQEALTNAAKHAPRSHATLDVRTAGAAIVVSLCNGLSPDGPAAPVAATGGGRGLLTMRERAEAVGGTLRAGPVGDQWQVRAVLPHRAR